MRTHPWGKWLRWTLISLFGLAVSFSVTTCAVAAFGQEEEISTGVSGGAGGEVWHTQYVHAMVVKWNATPTPLDTLRRLIPYYVKCYTEEMRLFRWVISAELEEIIGNEWQLAQTRWDASRYQAHSDYNLVGLRLLPDSSVRRVVVHETAHVLVAELHIVAHRADTLRAREEAERLVSRIERWRNWLRICP